jgi:tetratricopeptide (TPR) repeat protein
MELFSLPPDELERRHDELNAALDELVERDEPEMALGERGLIDFWMRKGHLDEGRRQLDRLLAAGDPPANLRAAGLYGAGVLAFRQGDEETARRLFEESEELARSSGDDAALAAALGGLSRVALRAGDPARTRELALEALELVEGEAAEYSPRHMLAAAARAKGDYVRAEELYGETLALSLRLGLRAAEAGELLNLGFVAARRGNAELARKRFRESLEIAAELEDEYLLPYCVIGAASSAFLRGDTDEGARLLAAAKAAFDRTGAAIDPGSAEEYEAMVAHLGHDYEAAWAEGSQLSLDEAVARARRARPV